MILIRLQISISFSLLFKHLETVQSALITNGITVNLIGVRNSGNKSPV